MAIETSYREVWGIFANMAIMVIFEIRTKFLKNEYASDFCMNFVKDIETWKITNMINGSNCAREIFDIRSKTCPKVVIKITKKIINLFLKHFKKSYFDIVSDLQTKQTNLA